MSRVYRSYEIETGIETEIKNKIEEETNMNADEISRLRKFHVREAILHLRGDIDDNMMLIKYKSIRLQQFMQNRAEIHEITTGELLLAMEEINIQEKSNVLKKLDDKFQNLSKLEEILMIIPE